MLGYGLATLLLHHFWIGIPLFRIYIDQPMVTNDYLSHKPQSNYLLLFLFPDTLWREFILAVRWSPQNM